MCGEWRSSVAFSVHPSTFSLTYAASSREIRCSWLLTWWLTSVTAALITLTSCFSSTTFCSNSQASQLTLVSHPHIQVPPCSGRGFLLRGQRNSCYLGHS